MGHYIFGSISEERGNYRLQVYFSFIQHISFEIACNMAVSFLSYLCTGPNFVNLESMYLRSFEMNRQQVYRDPTFCVGWMRGAFVCYSLSN